MHLLPGVSWAAVAPPVLRYLQQTAAALPSTDGKPLVRLRFAFGTEHPLYGVLSSRLSAPRLAYGWYIRVADMPTFLRHIAPALECRLAASACAAHTGDLRLGFYRSGVRIAFRGGRVQACETWSPLGSSERPHAAFPGLTFVQLLFGFRSLDDLRYAHPDCSAVDDTTAALLDVLFPRHASHVWAID
jgi:hypothetical protein